MRYTTVYVDEETLLDEVLAGEEFPAYLSKRFEYTIPVHVPVTLLYKEEGTKRGKITVMKPLEEGGAR